MSGQRMQNLYHIHVSKPHNAAPYMNVWLLRYSGVDDDLSQSPRLQFLSHLQSLPDSYLFPDSLMSERV